MKTKIAILGSTGSIGKNLFNILEKDFRKFQVQLLSTNTNYKELLKQANFFRVKNLIITNKKVFDLVCKNEKFRNFNLYNDFNYLNKIFKKQKIDYVMSAITGIDGLKPTVEIIKYTKKIAIANKEAIICGWKFIKKELDKYKTSFIPVDSEHFSIWFGLKNIDFKFVEKVFITASGGPFLNTKYKDLKNVKVDDAINHPNWRMGIKISIDSSTMMNKVFEVIEAKNIFNTTYKKISILVHPKSFIHSIIFFNNEMIKLIAHNTSMTIPIKNSLYNESYLQTKKNKVKIINLSKLNELKFFELNKKHFPLVDILDFLPTKPSLFETALVSANDQLVDLFINNKIKYIEIIEGLLSFLQKKEIKKLKYINKFTLNDIFKINEYVRLKISKKYI